MGAMPLNDSSKPLSRYDRRKLDLLLERTERGSVLHDAWLLLPQHDDFLYSDPRETLELVQRLRRRADTIEPEAIRLAVQFRIPWAEIGAVYGITKQAAWNRFAKPTVPALPL